MTRSLYLLVAMLSLYLLEAAVIPAGESSQSLQLEEVVPAQAAAHPNFKIVDHPGGVTLQSGSVSYLVPNNEIVALHSLAQPIGLLSKFLAIAPKLVHELVKVVAKAVFVAAVAFSLAFLGFGFTAALCTYTNFCSFKFAPLPWHVLDAARLEDTMRAYVSPDKLSTLANVVIKSIREYSAANKKKLK